MENFAFQFLEVLKYVLPALIVFLTAYFLLIGYFKREAAAKSLELKMKRDKEIVILRLQAYERLALFLERIQFGNVADRVRTPEMRAIDLQYAMERNIRDEYEYNLSQQIYVSSECWNMITQAKEEMIKAVNLIGTAQPPGTSAGVLINAILTGVQNANMPLPTEQALQFLKAECRELF